MSAMTVSWALFAAMAVGGILLLNYWASYQLLSTLAYSGGVASLLGLANLAVPFRFMGIRRRRVGALDLAAGVVLFLAALLWPAPIIRVAQPRTRLDRLMPEYQFSERHATRAHARPEALIKAVRESTFSDMKSLGTLLRIRAAAVRDPGIGDELRQRPVLEAFASSGYLLDGGEREVVMFGAVNARERRRPDVRTAQQFVDYHAPGGVKMAFDFRAEDEGGGWSTISTETRVVATDPATRSGMGRYWRLIVPGSGLLRRQWLDGIKRRAEAEP
jgi:hypothetical protein